MGGVGAPRRLSGEEEEAKTFRRKAAMERWSVAVEANNENDWLFIVGGRVRSVWDYGPGGLHARLWSTCGLTFVLLLASCELDFTLPLRNCGQGLDVKFRNCARV